MKPNHRHSGSAVVGATLLIIIALIILCIARHLWVDSANEHFDRLISVYILEKEDLSPDDRDRLKAQLIEPALFIKMHRWNRESFIQDKKLYNDMLITRHQRRLRKEAGSVIDPLINL